MQYKLNGLYINHADLQKLKMEGKKTNVACGSSMKRIIKENPVIHNKFKTQVRDYKKL